MTVRMTEMETLSASWESAERVLRDWGHEPEAEVVALCREELRDEIARKGEMRLGELVRGWTEGAAVLETYGHGDQAESLRRCSTQLRAQLQWEEGPDETAGSSRRAARSRRNEGRGGSSGDAEADGPGAAGSDAGSARSSWSA